MNNARVGLVEEIEIVLKEETKNEMKWNSWKIYKKKIDKQETTFELHSGVGGNQQTVYKSSFARIYPAFIHYALGQIQYTKYNMKTKTKKKYNLKYNDYQYVRNLTMQ